MTIKQLQQQTVGVLGFGQEGQAVCGYLLQKGIKPVVYDAKPLETWPEGQLAKLNDLDLKAETGAKYLRGAVNDCSVIFRSPGIKIPADMQSRAKQSGVTITSQTQWFFKYCPAKIIGITGTKGKGTTSSLLAEMLQQAHLEGNVYLTGNIGRIQPLEFLERLTEADWVVYELSSFQLQDLQQSPYIGICLMVTSDHLDYHQDLSEYHLAKKAISAFQTPDDFSVYNIDYPASKLIGESGSGQKWPISKKESIVQGARINESAEEIHVFGPDRSVVIPTKDRLLRGNHNLENIAAAALAATLIGIPSDVIKAAVLKYPGLEHRLQFVADRDGIKYYNDSISTIPETAIAAIRSFPAETLVLILGGSEKNLDYQQLARIVAESSNVKAVVTMGPVGERLKPLLISNNFAGIIQGPFKDFTSVMQAVKRVARAGDVVLLSPAAPSFDMFANYSARGHEFVKQVTQ